MAAMAGLKEVLVAARAGSKEVLVAAMAGVPQGLPGAQPAWNKRIVCFHWASLHTFLPSKCFCGLLQGVNKRHYANQGVEG